MSRIIYLNGSYVPEEEAKISVFDHMFLYGDGVFEGIRAYSGRVFKLDEHLGVPDPVGMDLIKRFRALVGNDGVPIYT